MLRGLLLLALVLASGELPPALAADPPSDVEVFVRDGCPHCAAAKEFLATLQRERPDLRVRVHDVDRDAVARLRLADLAAHYHQTRLGVPTFFLRGELIVGFGGADTTGARLRALLDLPGQAPEPEELQVPFFGRLTVRDVGLPLFTITIGLLDGFNPCAMWILLFLLSLLVNLRNRRTMALIAGTFVSVSGLVYFLFMAAWLNIFLLVGLSRVTQLVLGGLAVLAGGINVKDFFAGGRGVSLAIPEAARPGLYTRMRRILYAENLRGALLSIVALAILVNVVELLCTAGFPALYTQILTLRQLPWLEYYAYLGLYTAAYIFDDALMVTIAVATLGHHRLQERAGRWLKMLSGLVMLGLGLILILAPAWLTW